MVGLLDTCQMRTVLTSGPGFVVIPVERGQLWSFDVGFLTEG